MLDRVQLREIQNKAEAGDVEAMYELSKALRYFHDRSYEENIYYWLSRAADMGHMDAQFDYGIELAKTGQGSCIEYIKAAAAQGHEKALKILEKMGQ